MLSFPMLSFTVQLIQSLSWPDMHAQPLAVLHATLEHRGTRAADRVVNTGKADSTRCKSACPTWLINIELLD